MRPMIRLSLLASLFSAALAGSALAAPLTLWHHGGRGDAEPKMIAAEIEAWNKLNPDYPVTVVALPAESDDEYIQAKALSDGWPDILDFDGPGFAAAAWQGRILPLDGLVSKETIADLLPSIVSQGTYAPDGRLYVLGQFDSGLGIWGSRAALAKAGVRIPKGVDDAWTGEEFEDALARLKAAGYETPIDMKLSYGAGEWFTYGFSAIVASWGGDLIDRKTWRAEGTLNGPGAVKALTALQRWVAKGYVAPASAGDDPFYGTKKAALALVGHWMYAAHAKTYGDDLVLLPFPKFGDRHVTGMGSWNWGIAATSTQKEMAGKLLDFLMSPKNVEDMATAAGAIPARASVAASLPLYRPGGAMSLYVDQLRAIALPRPSHPAYPVITAAFAAAVQKAIDGGDVKLALDIAAARVDQEIDTLGGYQPFGGM